VKIKALKRVSGHEGTPTFEVTFDDGQVAKTAPGSQVAHYIENSEYQNTELDVEMNKDGRITALHQI